MSECSCRCFCHGALRLVVGLSVLALLLPPARATAFKVAPRGTRHEQSVAKRWSSWFERQVMKVAGLGVDVFTSEVHEEITQRSSVRSGGSGSCGPRDPDCSFVITGVRWNDDPPFRIAEDVARGTDCKVQETIRFTTQPWCWAQLFRDAQRRAAAGEKLGAGFALLYRSHFGDLQFVHSMASADGEPPEDTRRHILMWAEFTWRVATGEFDLGKELRAVPIDGFDGFFGSSGWRVQDLFTLGNLSVRNNVRELAFGSLLHTVHDSFAKSHAERREPLKGETCPGTAHAAPGSILEFHAYNRQSSDRHAKYDGFDALEGHVLAEDPDVVDVGGVLVEMFSRDAAWGDARPYLECVLTLDGQARKASAGDGFRP